VTPELLALATGSAAAVETIDVVYVARGRIAPTYLLDAAVQAALLVAIRRALRTPSSFPRARSNETRRSRTQPAGESKR
jgi:hypothetical protein